MAFRQNNLETKQCDLEEFSRLNYPPVEKQIWKAEKVFLLLKQEIWVQFGMWELNCKIFFANASFKFFIFVNC